MKPSAALCARVRFTTKEVGRGFYRGTQTGAMGAHTEYGGYVIDYRKVRNYNVPDMTDFKVFLLPKASRSIANHLPQAHTFRHQRNGANDQTGDPGRGPTLHT
jgi:Mitochondrial ribosomal protein L27